MDWPAAPFWSEISAAFPDALILLSVRDADDWWKSASNTIFSALATYFAAEAPDDGRTRMGRGMMTTFAPGWQDEASAKAAYLVHNDLVRTTAPKSRFLEWRPEEGWEPICAAQDLDVPDQPFPHANTTAQAGHEIGLDSEWKECPSNVGSWTVTTLIEQRSGQGRQSTATSKAAQSSRMRASARRPSRSTRTLTATLSTESRLTADVRGTGSSPGSRSTSLGNPRIVVVQGATMARRSRGMAASRERTTTGRRPTPASSHHQTSPRVGTGFTRQKRPHGTRPDLPIRRALRAGVRHRRRSWHPLQRRGAA